MDAAAVIQELESTYPGKLIKKLPEDNPTEIICEFEPKDEHPDFSFAIAVIDQSKPHHHKRTTEIYRVLKGELKLHVGNQELTMYEGQEWTILPGQVHWAEGNATWIEVYCSPGYEPSDHFLEE